jgi:hypothetical protein
MANGIRNNHLMNRLARATAIIFALVFSLTAGQAQQLQRVQAALEGLRQSAAALEQNDPAKALRVLGEMKTSVVALRSDVEAFRGRAEAATKEREGEVLEGTPMDIGALG